MEISVLDANTMWHAWHHQVYGVGVLTSIRVYLDIYPNENINFTNTMVALDVVKASNARVKNLPAGLVALFGTSL